MSQYQRLGAIDRFPLGEMRCIEVCGRRLLVAHTERGFCVSDERCTHEDASLCLGSLHGTTVSCSLHGARFDLESGAALDEPAEIPLRIYPCRVIRGNLEALLD